MALTIKSPEVDRLARQLAAVTGESITDALTIAMRERLAEVKRKQQNQAALLATMQAISAHCASFAAFDAQSVDEITR